MYVEQTQKSLGAWLEKNDKDLLTVLIVCKLETQRGKTPEVFDEERKVKSSYNKNHILENDQSCILSPTMGPEPLPVRSQVIWMMNATCCGG